MDLNFKNLFFNKQDEEILNYKHDYTKYHLIKHWIMNNPKKAKNWKGKYGETLLHWSIINNLEVTTMLIEYVGVDKDSKDKNELTPYDWLIERFFLNFVLNENKLNDEGRLFIMNQTNKHAIYLYQQKAKTKYDVVDMFSKSGTYEYIDYIFQKEGVDSLTHIGENQKSILHNWILLGESPEKHQKIHEILNYGIDINIKDKNGFTPLYYAFDGLLFKLDEIKQGTNKHFLEQSLNKEAFIKNIKDFFHQTVKTLLFLNASLEDENVKNILEKQEKDKNKDFLKWFKQVQDDVVKMKEKAEKQKDKIELQIQ